MSDRFEFLGEPQLMKDISTYFHQLKYNFPPTPLDASRQEPSEKKPQGILLTICENAVKVALGYFWFAKDRGIALEFEDREESIELRPGEQPEKLSSFILKSKHRRFKVSIKP